MAPTGLKKALSCEAVRLASQERVPQRLPQGLRAAHMVAQSKEVPKIVSQEESIGELSSRSSVSWLQRLGKLLVKLASWDRKEQYHASSGEAGPSWPGAYDMDSPGIAKQSATTEPELMESCGGAGPSWSRANGDSAADAAPVKSAGEARSTRIVKYSVDLELARVALQLRRGMWWENEGEGT